MDFPIGHKVKLRSIDWTVLIIWNSRFVYFARITKKAKTKFYGSNRLIDGFIFMLVIVFFYWPEYLTETINKMSGTKIINEIHSLVKTKKKLFVKNQTASLKRNKSKSCCRCWWCNESNSLRIKRVGGTCNAPHHLEPELEKN